VISFSESDVSHRFKELSRVLKRTYPSYDRRRGWEAEAIYGVNPSGMGFMQDPIRLENKSTEVAP
jgi:hypothetical protein